MKRYLQWTGFSLVWIGGTIWLIQWANQPTPSLPRMGACCREGPERWECFTVNEDRCTELGGDWEGYVTCSPTVCEGRR